jgi:hypothetical protein
MESMNDGYLKDQQYLYLFNGVAVKVIEHLSNIWEELEHIKEVLELESIIVFSTGLKNLLTQLPNTAKYFKT